MSGTSLDGIALAECFFSVSEENQWSCEWGKTETIPYSPKWKVRLQEAIHFSEEQLQVLNKKYTRYLGKIILIFIEKHSIKNLDAVCSHGHTILHQPKKGVTLQIGNLPLLAHLVGQTVVCDFRVQDVEMGGQGAPLVPIGDRLLFGNYDYCLNLGGFANCSFEQNGQRVIYDICPVNIVLNRYAEELGKPYDEDGQFAKSGEINQILLNQLNDLEFYAQPPPKSLGLEWVQAHVFPLLEVSQVSYKNILSTFTEHAAMQIAKQFPKGSKVLVTGGGTYNSYLLDRALYYKEVDWVVKTATLLEYKEALVFGLLGVLKLRNDINCLASVTGAKEDHCSGVVY